MTGRANTIIVGGGQAGLVASYYLTQAHHEHVVLEQAAEAGNVWRNGRWDSFTLLTPNWAMRLPGAEYQGHDPGGFMPRAEIVGYFEGYVERFNLPVRYGVRVTAVEQKPNANGYRYWVRADGTAFEAANVVMATGFYQQPRIPPFSASLPADIRQLHSGEYRNPGALPPGGVLVVGSGQSGCQITEELYQSGRQVYLCVGSAGRAPRRTGAKILTSG